MRAIVTNYPAYEVDSKGIIVSLPRVKYCGHKGSLPQNIKERILTGRKTQKGYLSVILYNPNGKKSFRIHRLVWEAFNGSIPEGMEINHKNGIKTDNDLTNLELVTHQENMSHAVTTRLIKNRKIGDAGRGLIKALYSKGFRQKTIGSLLGVAQQTVSKIVK